ncbi:lipoyl synthase [Rhodothermus profundi]|uniref:Lipoyl synthase n=1 Tax=Rhodothermus profundi TaxID=633813 RepID=A0A1M6QA35_9BACT|nr:lipoyl synthase [Rhodothermus profundi]SHK17051.1 lipoic acid synthetase [Rhodothermus profundi]
MNQQHTPSPRRRFLPGEIELKRVPKEPLFPEGDGGFFELPVIDPPPVTNERGRRPAWLRAKLPYGPTYRRVLDIVETHRLHTVCQSARCPNMGECWTAGTATFMILGNVCTRSCGFCAVKTGRPDPVDWDEPRRVAEAVRLMGIRHAVVTSVDRDDLEDGGAALFAETIRQIRALNPGVTVEVLIPDFQGNWDALQLVLDERPDILNHNIETVPRLYRRVRPQARYDRSLELLWRAKQAGLRTKSGIMVGLGETREEVLAVMDDFARIQLDIMTIGQYLQPTRMHLPVEEFVHPDVFRWYKEMGEAKGIGHVESGPLVRSSYHAEQHV